MKQHDIKKYFSVLLAIMIAILAGCLVILLVFRTQLLVNGAARILSILMPSFERNTNGKSLVNSCHYVIGHHSHILF